MRKLKNRRIPNGTYGGVRGRRAEARLLLDWGEAVPSAPPPGWQRTSRLPLRGSCRRLRGCISRKSGWESWWHRHRKYTPLPANAGLPPEGEARFLLAPPPGELSAQQTEGVHLAAKRRNPRRLATKNTPPCPLCGTYPKGKRLTAFCASLALLQNAFAATPEGGEARNSAPPPGELSAQQAEGVHLAAKRRIPRWHRHRNTPPLPANAGLLLEWK